MIEHDLSTSTSCVLGRDLHTFTCVQHSQEQLDIIDFCSLAMRGSCKRFFTAFCGLFLTVLILKVCSFRNCLAWVCCPSSHLQTRFAARIICGMSSSLVIDPLVCCIFSFRVFSLVLMLTSLEVSQFSSHIFQFAFQCQGGYSLCISWFEHADNFESISDSFT